MPYAHTNRHGDTLYLHAGSTPLGEPYEFRPLPGDGALDALPESYQVYEDPAGRLSLVLVSDALVTAAHAAAVRLALDSTDYAEFGVEVFDDAVVIMQPNWTRAELARILGEPVTALTQEDVRENTDYAPIMCVAPSAAVAGHFCLVRMDFDPIPGWSEPLMEGTLDTLLADLESHLRQAVTPDF